MHSVVLTKFPHPSLSLVGSSKHLVRYRRSDGIDLGGVLHLPPGYDIKDPNRPRLPLLLWAYPREFNDPAAASQVRDSPHRFSQITPLSPLVWLTQGYAVLQDPAFPILAKDGNSMAANETFVEQLVSSAVAAVSHVCTDLGAGDPSRVAIGGHSYGAFMTANLLCHAPNLFQCGISRSGAFNRTLTPFGFQSEKRNFWEAKDLYINMSPFVHAEKIQNPILLIHGLEDQNSGTFPEQSERFFQALQGMGKTTRLVMLPKEGHGYRARESVMHVLAETHAYLHTHCTSRPSDPTAVVPTFTSTTPTATGTATPTVKTAGAPAIIAAVASKPHTARTFPNTTAIVLAGAVVVFAIAFSRSRL